MLIYIAALVLAYICVSLYFLKHPEILHEKKVVKFPVRHISHRGGAGEFLENTLKAFRNAKACQTDVLELDCQITADNQIIVAHDSNLYRVAGIDKRVSDLLYCDLPPLRQELPLDFNRNFICTECSDRRIPLLKEVFEEFPDLAINLDVKDADEHMIGEVSKLICQYNREDLTIWGNYRDRINNKCRKHNRNIHKFFAINGVVLLMIYFYTGLLPFIPLEETFLELFMPSHQMWTDKLLVRGGLKFYQRIILKFIHFLLYRKALFEHLQKRGIKILLWVLNDEVDFDRAFNFYGADGVMTDFPTNLTNFLKDNHEFK